MLVVWCTGVCMHACVRACECCVRAWLRVSVACVRGCMCLCECCMDAVHVHACVCIITTPAPVC